jgi:hypothetical protein
MPVPAFISEEVLLALARQVKAAVGKLRDGDGALLKMEARDDTDRAVFARLKGAIEAAVGEDVMVVTKAGI